MAVSLWQDPAQKQSDYNKHGIIGRPFFLHQGDGYTLQVMGV